MVEADSDGQRSEVMEAVSHILNFNGNYNRPR